MPEFVQTEQPRTSTPAASLLDRLKVETLSIHRRLERDLNLLGPHLSRASYVRTLEAFYGFYQPFEEQIEHYLTPELQTLFEGRKKTPNLLRDLSFFAVQADLLPLCAQQPKLNTLPALLGALYVTEGATLGGQLIARHVQPLLASNDGQGCSFFCSYGAETGSMWKSFRAHLLAYSSPALDDGIVQGAQKTFEAMHRWLCPGNETA